jgi:hypothetical protein
MGDNRVDTERRQRFISGEVLQFFAVFKELRRSSDDDMLMLMTLLQSVPSQFCV